MLSSYGHAFLGPSSSRSSAASVNTLKLVISSVRFMGRRPPKPGKPPIVPPAKRVLFQTRQRPWMDAKDVKELLWRRHIYNNAILSLRKVFKQELEAKDAEGLGIEALKREEDEEFSRLLTENEKRNEEAARLRESHEKEEMLKAEREILTEIEEELSKREESVKERTKEVLEMVQRSKHFVTRENLDEKLREALENPVVYDFAIDLQGHKMYNPKPVKYLEGTPPRQTGRIYDVTLGKIPEKTAQHSQ